MFLSIVNEAFGYTHDRTLESSFPLIISMMREHSFLISERNKEYEHTDDGIDKGEEWVEMTDFKTGKKKKVKKVKKF